MFGDLMRTRGRRLVSTCPESRAGSTPGAPVHPHREEPMADEPRDQKPKIRLSQLSHGAG